jgi:hypothetical protein
MITTVIISSISVKPLEELFGLTGKRIRVSHQQSACPLSRSINPHI